jgi:hypothetical protein
LAILGNHDEDNYRKEPPKYHSKKIVKMLKEANITVLRNEQVNIEINGQTVCIVGLRDTRHGSPESEAGNRAEEAIVGDGPTLVLAHSPRDFYKIPKKVSLILSGHTHGGRVQVGRQANTIFTPLLYGLEPCPKRYAKSGMNPVPVLCRQKFFKGHTAEKNKHIFVTSGVASKRYGRLANPPEIVILSLNEQKPRPTKKNKKSK